jgi:hypothetical protein
MLTKERGAADRGERREAAGAIAEAYWLGMQRSYYVISTSLARLFSKSLILLKSSLLIKWGQLSAEV